MLNGTTTNPNGLFGHMADDFILPFVFVQRDSIMTDDQVSQILGALITASKLRAPILITLCAIGFLMPIVGGCMFKKLKQIEKDNHSYDSLERMRLVEETKYKNGLGSRNDKTLQLSSESS